ncbi:MAG: D-aminoacyl-tRNA deacylase [Candidatus Thermoplasmatota archaeon]
MSLIIVSSIEDPAGTNIKNSLLESGSWDKNPLSFMGNPVYQHQRYQDIYMVTINDRTIKHENLDLEIESSLHLHIDQMIYVSRHRSKTGEPTLTVHPIGNYNTADYGGGPKTLVQSSPRLMVKLLHNIKKHIADTDLPHQVCYEVTHHGPYIHAPVFFTEVGSTEEEWKKKKPADIIAESLLELFELYRYEKDAPSDIPVLVGIGGGHYAPRFTEIIYKYKSAFGHMIPSYHVDTGIIDRDMIKQALTMTPNAIGVYLHKKALKKSQITLFKQWLDEMNVRIISSKDLNPL